MHQQNVSPRWYDAYEELENIMIGLAPEIEYRDIRYMDRDGIKVAGQKFLEWEQVLDRLVDWNKRVDTSRIEELVKILREYPDPF